MENASSLSVVFLNVPLERWGGRVHDSVGANSGISFQSKIWQALVWLCASASSSAVHLRHCHQSACFSAAAAPT